MGSGSPGTLTWGHGRDEWQYGDVAPAASSAAGPASRPAVFPVGAASRRLRSQWHGRRRRRGGVVRRQRCLALGWQIPDDNRVAGRPRGPVGSSRPSGRDDDPLARHLTPVGPAPSPALRRRPYRSKAEVAGDVRRDHSETWGRNRLAPWPRLLREVCRGHSETNFSRYRPLRLSATSGRGIPLPGWRSGSPDVSRLTAGGSSADAESASPDADAVWSAGVDGPAARADGLEFSRLAGSEGGEVLEVNWTGGG